MASFPRAPRRLASDWGELRDVVASRLDTRRDRRHPGPPARVAPVTWENVQSDFERALGAELGPFLAEPALAEVAEEVRQLAEPLAAESPLGLEFNASARLASLCYAFCRAIHPRVVVETGVAYGATSAHILAALEQNGSGELHSIDWMPRSLTELVGGAVPARLRSAWHLERGLSGRILPKLLSRLDGVGVFVSDSSHTYRNVTRELNLAAPKLTRPGAVLVDDVEGHSAFTDWSERVRPTCSAVIVAGPYHACAAAVVANVPG